MDSKKVLDIIIKMQTLSENDLDKVDKAINACIIVSQLEMQTANRE